MTTKVCSKCRVEKGLGEFYKSKRTKDERDYYCKPCRCSFGRYKEDPEKVRARVAKWYAENREKAIGRVLRWKLANPEKVKVRDAKWAAENPEKRRAASARYVSSLATGYVIKRLNIRNPPQELIELKRLHLQIQRELRK